MRARKAAVKWSTGTILTPSPSPTPMRIGRRIEPSPSRDTPIAAALFPPLSLMSFENTSLRKSAVRTG